MPTETSFGIDMTVDLSQITGTDYLEMSVEEQRRVLTEVYREVHFNDVQAWSQYAFDVIEEAGINDYENGHSRIEIPIAFLRSTAMMLKQCFMEQHRSELQCLSEDTEFACQLAEAIFDRANELSRLAEDVVTLQGYYHAALQHRKESNANLLDAEGNTRPYSPEVIAKEQLLAEQREQEWKQDLQRQRGELEDAYWGKRSLPEVPEGYTSSQLVMPLWSVGFKPEEEN